MIYCYSAPGVSYLEGWVKIGYTESQSVKNRVAQQTHTAGIVPEINWQEHAIYKDDSGELFTDHEFHRYLSEKRHVQRKPDSEWFRVAAKTAREYLNDFADRRVIDEGVEHTDYTLRKEQQEAVEKTKAYFERGGKEFLWNAKPRFGKTLAAYDLIRQAGYKKVLVVTNRPSVANSWADDFNKFIGWRGELCFVTELDDMRGHGGVLSRREYVAAMDTGRSVRGFIEFESLQNLKSSVYFGGNYDKLEWLVAERWGADGKIIKGLCFDLLIVDEAHEGVDTMRTERAFRSIARNHTLYLTGTPFKALADGQFGADQIFNWTYADEQTAKENWDIDAFNPYEPLPRMALFTYQLSPMLYDRIRRGALLDDGESVDYAFDLNEFFATNENGKLTHEPEVKKFLHALTTHEKYPFSTPELRSELSHTLWLLNRVASARALARLLKDDPVFAEYEIVLAAGDGQMENEAIRESAFKRVKNAIAAHDKTITLSVGQLTVGVTIPEWCGVLMLCNMQSPAAYMQAAFRAQNPWIGGQSVVDGMSVVLRKETAYVFDFDPARTLVIFDEFANNLSPETAAGRGTGETRRQNIRRLLNFFPVLGEDDEGKMVELDAAKVLSIPSRLKCTEVVRHGFMSNFLFNNIANVFSAPSAVQKIIDKLTPAQEDPRNRRNRSTTEHISDVPLNEDGQAEPSNEIVIGKTRELFGPKVYANMNDELQPGLEKVLTAAENPEQALNSFTEQVQKTVVSHVVNPVLDNYNATKSVRQRIQRQTTQEIGRKIAHVRADFEQQKKLATVELERQRKESSDPEVLAVADQSFQKHMAEATASLTSALQRDVQELIQNKPEELIRSMEQYELESKKRNIEDIVRSRLRGFSRTIPSFIMAYGDENLSLANFDDYTEDDVFLQVTGISEADFRFLRDGGDYVNDVTGQTEHFDGHLFDETVFNDSIREFLRKKEELANYFDESHEEDIFDYIPPQKTNQIFTPRRVVQKMVDDLENENPGCFDDPSLTFADLYMKSGLYISEIVKRLYRSSGLKAAFPNEHDRIRHILCHQVFGIAPTRIIFLIATNYILGFDPSLKAENLHFVQADAAEAAKSGTLQELVSSVFSSNT